MGELVGVAWEQQPRILIEEGQSPSSGDVGSEVAWSHYLSTARVQNYPKSFWIMGPLGPLTLQNPGCYASIEHSQARRARVLEVSARFRWGVEGDAGTGMGISAHERPGWLNVREPSHLSFVS